MKHPHQEILKAYAEDTNVRIEYENNIGQWRKADILDVFVGEYKNFRIKPAMRSITLQDGTAVEFPEPMRDVPAVDSMYWVAYPSGTSSGRWTSHTIDLVGLKAGFCHLTEEAAQQHRRAIVLANGGEL